MISSQYCLDRLIDCGAAVEQVSEREFRVFCMIGDEPTLPTPSVSCYG
jgi:hypothetical protein